MAKSYIQLPRVTLKAALHSAASSRTYVCMYVIPGNSLESETFVAAAKAAKLCQRRDVRKQNFHHEAT